MNLLTETATRNYYSKSTIGMMRAMVYDHYGDANVIHAADHPLPHYTDGNVLIEVWSTSVNPIDYRIRRGDLKGLLIGGFPRIPGYDVAGIVVECSSSSAFTPGDRVMAFLDHKRGGATADYALCSENCVAKIPESMTMEEAAAIPLAATTALQSLRDHGKIKSGSRVLINGASGGVGMFAVQIAKYYDCHVDAVASEANREFCMSLGADGFYDYTATDVTKIPTSWDLIFDAAGRLSYFKAREVLNDGGRFVSTEPNIKGLLVSLLTWPLSKSGIAMLAKPCGDDLRKLIALYELGKLNVTIDRRFSFSRIVEAHQRVEQGVDHGKVVLINKFE